MRCIESWCKPGATNGVRELTVNYFIIEKAVSRQWDEGTVHQY